MNIVISGSTGLVGQALTNHFRLQGHRVIPLIRSKAQDHLKGIVWDIPEASDIVVHLAGAPISKRWTKKYKELIVSSRVDSTRLLSDSLSRLKQKPRLFICASAVGVYGPHPVGTLLDESCPGGEGFLAEVARQWEEATAVASKAGIRVVHLRFGMVLSKNGGALAAMLPIFKLGLGGVIGKGTQMISWIALDEIPLIVDHVIGTESLSGPVNVTAPQTVQNREFVQILGEVIKRPVFLPVPAWGIKLLLGQMAQELLLEGQEAVPAKLQSSGYVFKYPNLQLALQRILTA